MHWQVAASAVTEAAPATHIRALCHQDAGEAGMNHPIITVDLVPSDALLVQT
jgi:hypothetical protein